MNASHILHIIGALAFMLSLLGSESLSKDDNAIRCIEAEWKALQLFKQGVVRGAQRHDLGSWRDEEKDCCKWKGVGCDNRTGHVTHLFLSSRISAFTDSTSVSVDKLLIELPYLNYLDLSNNLLAGIPEFIGSLTNLIHLDLSETYIDGAFPDQIGNSSNLQYLNLSLCCNGGPIPKFIGSLNNLRYLDISNSWFTGVISHELGSLSRLQHLNLANNCHLRGGGNFEWLFNLSFLTHLDLSNTPSVPFYLSILGKKTHTKE